jgi:hypothetical protein
MPGTNARLACLILVFAGLPGSPATPARAATGEVSLIEARAENRTVILRWVTSDLLALATVERDVEGIWTRIGRAISEDAGVRSIVDRDVSAGSRYRYRLRLESDDGVTYSEVADVTVPREALAIAAIEPNPSRGRFGIRLARPVTTNARVDLYDLAGRRVFRQDFAVGIDTDRFRVSPSQPLATGLYLVRISEGGRQATARIAIVR